MKLDFLPDGDYDRPLVRIWAFVPAEARSLHEAVTRLAGGQTESIEVHSLTGMEPINGCRLTLKVGAGSSRRRRFPRRQKDRGLHALTAENSFECLLRPHKWEQVADLIQPFCDEARPGTYQWLHESGDISLLLSVNGEW